MNSRTSTNVGMTYVWSTNRRTESVGEKRKKKTTTSKNFFIEIGSREGVNNARVIINFGGKLFWSRNERRCVCATYTRRGDTITRMNEMPGIAHHMIVRADVAVAATLRTDWIYSKSFVSPYCVRSLPLPQTHPPSPSAPTRPHYSVYTV